jgi:hypothetical protein
MRAPTRRPCRQARVAALLLASTLAVLLAGCSGALESATADAKPTPAPTPVPTPSSLPQTQAPDDLTPSPTPPPSEPALTTTETDWGTIVDSVPSDFPVYPDAKSADAIDTGPVSAAWTVAASAADVATWYRRALAATGYSTNDRSGPLEDGSFTVDTSSDLPECRILTTARPLGDRTLITVMFGAGCVALGG